MIWAFLKESDLETSCSPTHLLQSEKRVTQVYFLPANTEDVVASIRGEYVVRLTRYATGTSNLVVIKLVLSYAEVMFETRQC